MNPNTTQEPRVLAIAPCVQGLGFVFFNEPQTPIDWGVKWVRGEKNAIGLANVADLINCYKPDVVVIEDCQGEGSHRSKRIEDFLDEIAALAQRHRIKVIRYSRNRMRQGFAAEGAVTKHQIATAIAKAFPEFAPRVPPIRKIWLPEHANLSLFDAIALALTYFAAQEDASDRARAA
jgi:Holliday junction resolvasome RuvABC endonuclease subunit